MQYYLDWLYFQIDPFLIYFYRITGVPLVDYFIGTFNLAMICVVVGELSISLAIRLNKRYLDAMAEEITEKERLSFAAYQAGKKTEYQALNKDATDVWGKHFFTMAAYSAGLFWPLPFALGWMQTRFADVTFDLVFPLNRLFVDGVGYTFTFIPLYILGRIVFKYLRPRLPYFRGVQQMLDTPKKTAPAQ
ncbi:MAG: hypothetical protein LJE65_15260 [Desulfobacteraceae bacterium]|nr:hypothetical protein [Desulfobacteraceae bacterium]